MYHITLWGFHNVPYLFDNFIMCSKSIFLQRTPQDSITLHQELFLSAKMLLYCLKGQSPFKKLKKCKLYSNKWIYITGCLQYLVQLSNYFKQVVYTSLINLCTMQFYTYNAELLKKDICYFCPRTDAWMHSLKTPQNHFTFNIY